MSEREHGNEFEEHDIPLVALYNAVEVPPDFTPDSVDDPKIQSRVTHFFDDILTALRFNELMRQSAAVVEVERTAVEGADDASYDETHSLALRDLQALATVTLAVRGGQAQSFKAGKEPLKNETIEAIKGYHEGDTFLTHILFRE